MIKYFCDVCETQIPANGQFLFHSLQGPDNGSGEYRFCEADGMKVTDFVNKLVESHGTPNG